MVVVESVSAVRRRRACQNCRAVARVSPAGGGGVAERTGESAMGSVSPWPGYCSAYLYGAMRRLLGSEKGKQ